MRYLIDAKGKVIGHRPESERIVLEASPLISKARWDRLPERFESANSRSGRPSDAARHPRRGARGGFFSELTLFKRSGGS